MNEIKAANNFEGEAENVGYVSSGNLYPASSASLPKLPADAATIAQRQDGSKFNRHCSDQANLRSGSKRRDTRWLEKKRGRRVR